MTAHPQQLTIRRPDDWHIHLRDDAMLNTVLPYTSAVNGRAIVMPNLVPPVTSVAAAVACFGFIKTSGQLDAISTVGLGFMYLINLPLLLILGSRAMRAYHDYFRRLALGQIRRSA